MARYRTATAALVLVVATACGGGGPADPQQAVVEAINETADSSFAFALSADVRGASGDPGAAQALAVLRNARITGVNDEDGTVSLVIEAMGLEFGEVRRFEGGALFIRANTQAINDMTGGLADPSVLLEELPADVPADLRSFAEAALRGEWVGFEGSLGSSPEDLDLPADAPFSSDDAEELIDGLRGRFGDLGAAVEEFTTITEVEVDDGGDRRFAVDVDVEAIVRAFAGVFEEATGAAPSADDVQRTIDDLPATVSGIQVDVTDGLVSRVTVDFAQVFAALGETGGFPDSAVLALDLSDHGSVDTVERPTAAAVLTQETLQEMFGSFMLPMAPTATP